MCRGVMVGDYEKLVDREVRAAIQRMQAAEDAKREGLRTWRLPESLKVCIRQGCMRLACWNPISCCVEQLCSTFIAEM